jgi:hypothetical protein
MTRRARARNHDGAWVRGCRAKHVAKEDVGEQVPVGRERVARDDIADPYRRGPDVNAACAARIDELLDVVLPALAP